MQPFDAVAMQKLSTHHAAAGKMVEQQRAAVKAELAGKKKPYPGKGNNRDLAKYVKVTALQKAYEQIKADAGLAGLQQAYDGIAAKRAARK
jgi:hypothetical protein